MPQHDENIQKISPVIQSLHGDPRVATTVLSVEDYLNSASQPASNSSAERWESKSHRHGNYGKSQP